MAKTSLRMQPSERAVARAAAAIYAGRIAHEGFSAEKEEERIEQSLQTAIAIAKRADELVQSDTELG